VSDPTRPPTAPVRWLTDDEQQAWRSIIRGTRHLIARLDHDLKPLGLTGEDYGVLVSLSEADGQRLRMAELAATSAQSRSRLSHHIKRLESRGLVVRESCEEDRRGQFATLTPTGRQLLELAAPHHVAGVREHLLDHLSADDLAILGEVFGRLDPVAPDCS
jgi:DNA-binding MarR family transcriptional regulator